MPAARPLLIHCVRVNSADLDLMADHDAAIAHCPVANARLGHGTAPIMEARAAGIRVGLGTDSVASNNRLDLLEEARIAQITQRARLSASGALLSEELLGLVTIDGARALGLDAVVGSIEPGKDADLCVVGLDAPHTVPAPSIISTLFQAARGTDVRMTMVQGRVLYDGQTVGSLDEASLRVQIEELALRLLHAREASA